MQELEPVTSQAVEPEPEPGELEIDWGDVEGDNNAVPTAPDQNADGIDFGEVGIDFGDESFQVDLAEIVLEDSGEGQGGNGDGIITTRDSGSQPSKDFLVL